MKSINKSLVIFLLVGTIGLALIFIFDPTHNFPNIKINVELEPGQEVTLDIPTTSALQWVVEFMADPYLWVETNADNLAIKGRNSIIPDIIMGFLPDSDQEILTIINPTNNTIAGWLKGIRSPPPDKLGDIKNRWYIAILVLILIVGAMLFWMKPAPTINVRAPAVGSIGQLSGTTIKEPKCAKCRGCCVMFTRSFCMRGVTGGALPV